jgi:hypothetical protein
MLTDVGKVLPLRMGMPAMMIHAFTMKKRKFK